MDEDNSLVCASEYIKDRLYFVTLRINTSSLKPRQSANTHYFCIDDDLVYENFYADFGPLNLAMLYRYCMMLQKKLQTACYSKKKIVHYTTMDSKKRINAAFLIASYAIIYLKKTPEQAYRPLNGGTNIPFTTFRDASVGFTQYTITLMDCLQAVYKAFHAGFFNFDDFDVQEYEFFERVENGDLNWMLPQKFIAFCGPHDKSRIEKGYPLHSPETYVKYFKSNQITTIVRLNKRIYDAVRFTDQGFLHRDLFFVDGSTPNDNIMQEFLDISESTNGGVAVHCKAGLGRTGSLIACYIMKHYGWTALETIAWTRLCRPGSIIGHQQHWLQEKQEEMWKQGEAYRKLHSLPKPVHTYGVYSQKWKELHHVNREFTIECLTSKTDVSRILQQVDTMKIVDLEDTNKNKHEPPISSEQVQETTKSTAITQGDKLNQIKALRRHARTVTTSAIRDDIRPRTRAKSQPFRTTTHVQSPHTVLSPLKPSRIVTTTISLKEKEGVSAKRTTRTPTPPAKRTSWLLSTNTGSNRSLNITKVCRDSVNTLTTLVTPEPQTLTPPQVVPMTLRSADRHTRYQSAHRHGRNSIPRTYKSTLVR